MKLPNDMSTDSKRISIIIVNWNTRDLLLQCLRSIRENAADVAHEVVVVDNASSDGSIEAVRAEFPQARLIANRENRGFGAANNQGLAESTGDFILMLNPDTLVPEGSIRALLDFAASHEDVGIVGPRLVDADGVEQISSFGLFPSPLEAAAHALRIWRIAPRSRLARRFVVTPDQHGDWAYAGHLLGACLLVRRDLITRLGGFDEGFFLFLEETDLCFRARQQGWRCAYFTGAQFMHLGEQSMQGILHKTGGLYIRSYNLFCRKHGIGPLRLLAANLFLCLGLVIEATVGLVKFRSPRRAADSLRALWYGYVASPIR